MCAAAPAPVLGATGLEAAGMEIQPHHGLFSLRLSRLLTFDLPTPSQRLHPEVQDKAPLFSVASGSAPDCGVALGRLQPAPVAVTETGTGAPCGCGVPGVPGAVKGLCSFPQLQPSLGAIPRGPGCHPRGKWKLGTGPPRPSAQGPEGGVGLVGAVTGPWDGCHMPSGPWRPRLSSPAP